MDRDIQSSVFKEAVIQTFQIGNPIKISIVFWKETWKKSVSSA